MIDLKIIKHFEEEKKIEKDRDVDQLILRIRKRCEEIKKRILELEKCPESQEVLKADTEEVDSNTRKFQFPINANRPDYYSPCVEIAKEITIHGIFIDQLFPNEPSININNKEVFFQRILKYFEFIKQLIPFSDYVYPGFEFPDIENLLCETLPPLEPGWNRGNKDMEKLKMDFEVIKEQTTKYKLTLDTIVNRLNEVEKILKSLNKIVSIFLNLYDLDVNERKQIERIAKQTIGFFKKSIGISHENMTKIYDKFILEINHTRLRLLKKDSTDTKSSHYWSKEFGHELGYVLDLLKAEDDRNFLKSWADRLYDNPEYKDYKNYFTSLYDYYDQIHDKILSIEYLLNNPTGLEVEKSKSSTSVKPAEIPFKEYIEGGHKEVKLTYRKCEGKCEKSNIKNFVRINDSLTSKEISNIAEDTIRTLLHHIDTLEISIDEIIAFQKEELLNKDK